MNLQLGGKGANLCEMARMGLPVPPGFTITTSVCQDFYRCGGCLPPGLVDEIRESVALVEKVMGRKFGDPAGEAVCKLCTRTCAAGISVHGVDCRMDNDSSSACKLWVSAIVDTICYVGTAGYGQ